MLRTLRTALDWQCRASWLGSDGDYQRAALDGPAQTKTLIPFA
jgi:hypothetical protein